MTEYSRQIGQSLARNLEMTAYSRQISETVANALNTTAFSQISQSITKNLEMTAYSRQISETVANALNTTAFSQISQSITKNLEMAACSRQISETVANALNTTAFSQISQSIAATIEIAAATRLTGYLSEEQLAHEYQAVLKTAANLLRANEARSDAFIAEVDSAATKATVDAEHLPVIRYVVAIGTVIVLILVLSSTAYQRAVADMTSSVSVLATVLRQEVQDSPSVSNLFFLLELAGFIEFLTRNRKNDGP